MDLNFFDHLEQLSAHYGVELTQDGLNELVEAQGGIEHVTAEATDQLFREAVYAEEPELAQEADRAPEPPEQHWDEPDEDDEGYGDEDDVSPEVAADGEYLHKELGRGLTDPEAERLLVEVERQRRNGFQDLADAATDAGIKPLTEMSGEEHRAFAKQRLTELDDSPKRESWEFDNGPDASKEETMAWARARYEELNNGEG